MTQFTLAHLSDIHLSPLSGVSFASLLSKRLTGYINWKRERGDMHQRPVLDQLIANLHQKQPSHIAVTGDLVNIGLDQEYLAAQNWLHQLGSEQHVSLVPGNHDAYIKGNHLAGLAHWRGYMQNNAAGIEFLRSHSKDVPHQPSPDHLALSFPYLRLFDRIAIIGLSSAIPTLPFIAAGALSKNQLERLPELLESLGHSGYCRVVLIHHPPLPGQSKPRRALRNANEFKHIIEQAGAELILHGHNHRNMRAHLETKTGPAAVIGVSSASYGVVHDFKKRKKGPHNMRGSHDAHKTQAISQHSPKIDRDPALRGEPVVLGHDHNLARYNLYHISARNAGNKAGWRIELEGFGLAHENGPIAALEQHTILD